VTLQSFSLLWPGGAQRPRAGGRLSPSACVDLDLGEVARALSGRDKRREAMVWSVLTEVGTDAETIAYRQEVTADLLADPRLAARLSAILPLLAELGRKDDPTGSHEDDWGILELTRRLTDLSLYVRAVTELRAALTEATPRSGGLLALKAGLAAEMAGETFRALEEDLPPLRDRLKHGECITIAINLKPSWEPESAAILSIGPRTPGKGSMLDRLFHGAQPDARGLSPLRRADPLNMYNQDNVLFRDLRALLEATAGPALSALEKFQGLNASKLTHLEPEFSFYIGAAALIGRLQAAGLPLCRPEVAPAQERACRVEGGYNIALALRLLADRAPGAKRIVPSAITFDGDIGRIWILTGPNRGGKTTFIRAAGLTHILFAAGLPVPGTSARISPVDNVITHFLAPETAKPGAGRLDEEAERLAEVFAEATPQSLVLLNEVLAGTSQAEALGLATDAVRGFRLLGARCIYATHLHDLAAATERINASVPEADSPVASLVAGVLGPDEPQGPDPIVIRRPGEGAGEGAGEGRGTGGGGAAGSGDATGSSGAAGGGGVADPADRGDGEPRPTFHIVPGPPRGQSFASAIARQHGISFDQLERKLGERGFLRGREA